MPSNHLMLCHSLLLLPSIFPRIRVFSRLFASCGQSSGASASASIPPVNIQGWFPLGLTGLISLQSKGFSKVFSKPQFESINSSVLSLPYGLAVRLLGMFSGLLKPRLLSPTPRVSVGLGWGREFAFITSSQVIPRPLLIWDHTENPWARGKLELPSKESGQHAYRAPNQDTEGWERNAAELKVTPGLHNRRQGIKREETEWTIKIEIHQAAISPE